MPRPTSSLFWRWNWLQGNHSRRQGRGVDHGEGSGRLVPRELADASYGEADGAAQVTMERTDFIPVLRAAQAGEEWAAAALFRDLQPRLIRFLRSQEPRVADDLAAEVWVAIAENIDQFDGDAVGLRAWVFTIARRRLIEYRRRATRRKTDVSEASTFRDLPAPDAPERDALTNLSGQAAVDLISQVLPAEHAEVVLLRVLGDLETADVAAILGRSENWVRVTQHRALRRLAERLGPKLGVTR